MKILLSRVVKGPSALSMPRARQRKPEGLSMASVRPNGRHWRPFCKAVQKRQGRHNLAAEQACATGHKGNFSFEGEWI